MALSVTKSEVKADEKLAAFQKNRDRDEFQVEMDGEVGSLVSQWLAVEDPKAKAEDRKVPEHGKAKVAELARPKARYHVDPDDKNAFKDVLRRSGTLHKVEMVFLYPEGMSREPVDEKTGKAAVTVTVAPRSPKRTH
jgi:hypothetical protein